MCFCVCVSGRGFTSFVGAPKPLQLYMCAFQYVRVCVCVCVCVCVLISFKCVGSLSYASLGIAPGFPAPPGHL